jgi:lysozyme family protein
VEQNFGAFISFVWPKNGDFDSPLQGYHVTPGDPGGGTKGGVIETTWAHYLGTGLVTGALSAASDAQLELVLKAAAWGSVCDALPSGLDLMVANGRMMSGYYPEIFQQTLGFTGKAVDGSLGPITLARAKAVPLAATITSLAANHEKYLQRLSTWTEFGKGWTRRIEACKTASLALAAAPSQAVS